MGTPSRKKSRCQKCGHARNDCHHRAEFGMRLCDSCYVKVRSALLRGMDADWGKHQEDFRFTEIEQHPALFSGMR